MKTNWATRVASIAIAIATLSYPLPALAQTPDAKAGSVIVETQKPKAKAAPRATGGVDPSIIIIVGGRSKHVATPTKKAATDTTAPVKAATPP